MPDSQTTVNGATCTQQLPVGGRLAFGSIGATFTVLIAASAWQGDTRFISITNTTPVTLEIAWSTTTTGTTSIFIPPSISIARDFAALNALVPRSAGDLRVRYLAADGAPASGQVVADMLGAV